LEADIKKKTLATLVITETIFVLGLATTALGAIQSGLPFKQYISLTIKNPVGAQITKQGLGNANVECGGQGEAVRTNKVVCNQAISFMNQTC